jgi:sec-independent protein translocase protein TatA
MRELTKLTLRRSGTATISGPNSTHGCDGLGTAGGPAPRNTSTQRGGPDRFINLLRWMVKSQQQQEGAGKIPQLGEGLGKAIKGFKKSVNEPDAADVTTDHDQSPPQIPPSEPSQPGAATVAQPHAQPQPAQPTHG